MTEAVHITEVGPRDGLQNEPARLSLEDRLELVDDLVAAGLRQIELGSFVNPKAVPAMADTDALVAAVKARHGCGLRGIGLVMNDKGLDRALAAGADGVCIVTVVSETLCQKNNRCSAEEATATAVRLVQRAKASGLYARVDIATAWVCPYEGQITLEAVQRHADRIWEFQPDEMAFCDSIGHAHPYQVASLFGALGERYGLSRLVAHFHDTQALGLANATAAMMQGVRRFDASLGGLGGCPFAPGAKGNLATEDLVHLCETVGLVTNIRAEQLWPAVARLEERIGRSLGGQSKAWFTSKALHAQDLEKSRCKN